MRNIVPFIFVLLKLYSIDLSEECADWVRDGAGLIGSIRFWAWPAVCKG